MPAFRQVLEAAARAYTSDRERVDEQARRLIAALRARPRGVAEEPPGTLTLAGAARAILASADHEHGGFGQGPKFPTPTHLDALLASLDVLPEAEGAGVLAFVVQTCQEMARRGLYDHLGGGFHRYCVDGHWGVPHFEKMLYDQGLLLRSYGEAWRRSGCTNDDLVWPQSETFAWLEREMVGPEGGFYASQDADSEGVEGKFYVWTPRELREALGPERAEAFSRAYGVGEAGNFEDGTTVLWDVERGPRDALAAERRDLLAWRARRTPPGTDRKRVASWNGYAISGLALCGSLRDEPAMLERARVTADFVLARMADPSGRPLRIFNEGRAHTGAFLDDVASMLTALLDLHRAGAGPRYLDAALRFADDLALRFFDADEGDLFLTPSDGESLAERPRSDQDGATPHSTGLAVLGLLRAATLSGSEPARRVAETILRTHAFLLERAPGAFPTLARAAAWGERGLSVAVVVGRPDDPVRAALAHRARRVLAPEEAVVVVDPAEPTSPALDPAWLEGRLSEGPARAYVCRGLACSLPITEPDDLSALPLAPETFC
jgi:uncharacterized protein YyaL (SSP411 family)